MVGCSATSEVKMPGVSEVSAAAKAPAVNPRASPAAMITLHVCPSSQSPAGYTLHVMRCNTSQPALPLQSMSN